jgi:hypothetical protein
MRKGTAPFEHHGPMRNAARAEGWIRRSQFASPVIPPYRPLFWGTLTMVRRVDLRPLIARD